MERAISSIDQISTKELNYGKLGTWIFLTSEVMLFGALFSSYILLRADAPIPWKHGWDLFNIPLATLNTAFLITSSVTMVFAYAAIRAGELPKFKKFLWATILLGCAFLCVKYFEYTGKFHHGIFPSTNLYYAIYFTMTGLHVLHVIGGLIVNTYFVGPGSKLFQKDPEHFANRIECAGLYWHFVDVVWIFLFPSIYLL